MQRAEPILQALGKLGEKGLPLNRVYRSLYSEDLFLKAYGKIYSNRGATTPGTEADTASVRDGDVTRHSPLFNSASEVQFGSSKATFAAVSTTLTTTSSWAFWHATSTMGAY